MRNLGRKLSQLTLPCATIFLFAACGAEDIDSENIESIDLESNHGNGHGHDKGKGKKKGRGHKGGQPPVVSPIPGETDLTCPSATACFTLEGDGRNLTHAFIEVEADCVPGELDFDVYVDGELEERRMTGGQGLCPDISRDFWFPLPGPSDTAEVCVVTHGFVPSRVQVGTRIGARNPRCAAAEVEADCKVCEEPKDPKDPKDPHDPKADDCDEPKAH